MLLNNLLLVNNPWTTAALVDTETNCHLGVSPTLPRSRPDTWWLSPPAPRTSRGCRVRVVLVENRDDFSKEFRERLVVPGHLDPPDRTEQPGLRSPCLEALGEEAQESEGAHLDRRAAGRVLEGPGVGVELAAVGGEVIGLGDCGLEVHDALRPVVEVDQNVDLVADDAGTRAPRWG